MKWSSDQSRAIYTAAGTTDGANILSSVGRDGGDVKLLSTTEAIAESVFETSDSFQDVLFLTRNRRDTENF